MSVALPFNFGDNIVELGGGEKPLRIEGLKTINVDVRQTNGVDIVRNLEEDFSDLGKYDGIISVYLAEHIGWRKIQGFFKSCYNILKDGKPAVFIIPDTEEQMRLALTKEFDLGTSEMIFGGQDYGDNAHKVAFSKSFVTKLLKEAGFSEVNITNHPDPQARDIIVVATKGLQRSNSRTVVDGKPVYEEAYFTTDAYTFGGYRDFPVHALTVQKILERKPKSVVELGGAMGFICKRLGEASVPATCLDVSKYCYNHRATDDFVLMDLAKDKIPKLDKEYDLAFSIAFLEHIPPEDVEHTIRESMRVSKRGLHGITFTIEPNDIDETHCFPNGTLVTMWDGNKKPIESLHVGDITLGEENGDVVFSRVEELFERKYNGELIEIKTNNGIILSATPEHPIKQGDTWIPIKHINQCSVLVDDAYEALGYRRGQLSQGVLEDTTRIRDCYETESNGAEHLLESKIPETRTQETGMDGTGVGIINKDVEGILSGGHQISIPYKELGRDSIEGERIGFKTESPLILCSLLSTSNIREGKQTIQPHGYAISLFSRICRWGREYWARYAVWNTSTTLYDTKYRQSCYRLYSRINQWGCSMLKISKQPQPQTMLQDTSSGVPVNSNLGSIIALSNNKERTCNIGASIHQGENRTWISTSIHKRGEGDLLRSEEVKQKRNYPYTDTVYNLRTTTNNYFANDILVHNCIGTIKPREWWVDKFKSIDPTYPVEILDKEDLERNVPVGESDMMKYLRGELKEGSQ